MKIIKYLLFLLLILVIAGSIYVATKDGEFKVQSSKVIQAPAPMLYNEVSDFSNWKTWETWRKIEGIAFEIQRGTNANNASMSWQAEGLPDGKIVTTSAIPYSKLTQHIEEQTLVGPADAEITWTFQPGEDGTTVHWSLSGSHSFKEKLAFTLQEHSLPQLFRSLFEKSLEDIEKNVQRKMQEYSINVDGVTEHGGGYYMYTTTASRFSEVNTKAAEMIKQVRIYMQKNNISISGKPFVIYNQRDERNSTSIFSAAVPTPSQVITPAGSQVLNGYLEPQKVVKTTLRGNHTNAAEAWERAYRYMEQNNLQVDPAGQAFEIYINGPETVGNPALWVTEIYIPVL